jgi:hypothetical protein
VSNAQGLEGGSIARLFPRTGNPIPDATRYQVDWNAHCDRGDRYLRMRVEDLDVGRLGRIAALIGRDVDDDAIVRALEQVPIDFNTRHNAWPLGWDDLPDGPSKEALRRMAVRYHYPTD